MNSPMPTAMPSRMLGLMALRIASRTPKMERSRNKRPERKTTPSAICQGVVEPGTIRPAWTRASISALAAGIAEKTKKKFSPMPGAWAIG